MKRPGVMLYFDIRPSLKRLTTEEKGQLFEAILEYAEFEKIPKFDGCLGVAWDFIQPRIDKDRDNYRETVYKKQYAVFTREAKKYGIEPPSFEVWRERPDKFYQVLSHDSTNAVCYPTTTTTTTPTTTSSSTTTSTETRGIRGEAEFNDSRNRRINELLDWKG